MNRTELERLDRDALIARAEAAGVTGARILTRPELVDELLVRSADDAATKARSRGLFGRARDLLARAVERRLHLPETADIIRSLGASPLAPPRAPAALPTVTLAEIYAAQGHRSRAIETLERVLAAEPDHAPARALLVQLHDDGYASPPARLPPEEDEGAEAEHADADGERSDAPPDRDVARHEEPAVGAISVQARSPAPAVPGTPEPAHMLDDSPLPTRYDVDECVAIAVDPTTLYVYWEAREPTLEYVRATRPSGRLVLRAVVIRPSWDGPSSEIRDYDVLEPYGDFFVRRLPSGCVVRVAVGYAYGEAFVPIAHSSVLETATGSPWPLSADVLVRWTPDGAKALMPEDADAPSIDRAIGVVRREIARIERARAVPDVSLGGSERWAVAPAAQNTSNG